MNKTNPLKRPKTTKARLMNGTAFQLVAANYRAAEMFLRKHGLQRINFLAIPERITSKG